ncbi:MAG TPA: vanadium-dependent haloperoxidase [Vicinamibacterales bacterium]|jgi:hypothetical protein|nr:vanadium-dependent haloperoxidase [Vicinamibacterales bacterium]
MSRTTTLIATVAGLALLAPSGRDISAHGGGGSPTALYQWNQILQDTIPGGGGAGAPRFYAITHIAIFDAVNAIEREFEPYFVPLRNPANGSAEAAAAQAAHDVLVALNPAATTAYDTLLQQQLGSNPNGFVRQGAQVGARTAAKVLAWRQHDGWIVSPFPPYSEPLLPGRWQPTPPNNPVPTFTHVQQAEPLAMVTPTQFLPVPPPILTSATYATDLNEVKLIGKSDSATRSPEQTAIARLWASVAASGSGTATHNFAIWNNIARDLSQERQMTLVEAARLFAMMNVSIHDALHTTLTSKFVYGVWRPVTAVRQADTDLNAATDPDPNWLPLLTTPPYPSYAGNMATIGASAARALQLVLGTNRAQVHATWKQSGGQPDVTHTFNTIGGVAKEQSESRIYGGIHYRFDQVAGQKAGIEVAEYVFGNFMTPR